MAGVSFDRVTKQFGTVTAVDELSLEIESGEFVVLVVWAITMPLLAARFFRWEE